MPKPTPLKIAIVASGMTFREVAARIGRHESQVSRWANAARACDPETQRALADTLGRPAEELFPVDDDLSQAA